MPPQSVWPFDFKAKYTCKYTVVRDRPYITSSLYGGGGGKPKYDD